ncbi:MAG: ribonuclease P protein component, partial [Bacilli bacterium]|nr:ribonuclease P protein component [Bacilli bacterium]
MRKVNIIKKNIDFERIITQKNFYKTPYFYIFVAKNELGFSRYGIGVSKKIKNVVTKNKIKRQVKAIINQNKLYNKAVDYVIIVNS